jgi:TldD protein
MALDRREFIEKMLAFSASAALAPGILDLFKVDEAAGSPLILLDEDQFSAILKSALVRGGDFSEIYYEAGHSLTLVLSEGVFNEATIGFSEGTGVRTVDGVKNGYAYINGLDFDKLKDAAVTSAFIASSSVLLGHAAPKIGEPRQAALPGTITVKVPIDSIAETKKMELLQAADEAARSYNPAIKQVDLTYFDQLQKRVIANSNGLRIENEIPMIWVVAEVLAEKNGVRHQGRCRISAHQGFEFFDTNSVTDAALEAAREAVVMLSAQPAPSGMMPVVMESGWGGVLVHEAVGHGLEGDVIYRGTSIYADKIGKKVASDLVTFVDDSSWPNARGTYEFDDEGTIGKRNVLIDKGILVGFMHDLISAKILKMQPSGNGRRESYRYYPIPRMTNTFLDNGSSNPPDIIAGTTKGIYIKSLSGGSVDTISGQFNFIVREAYLIENGKIMTPVSGATLIGKGIDVLTNIDGVGNDLKLGVGICGKEQWVPVTAGIPTVRIANGITVGGIA